MAKIAIDIQKGEIDKTHQEEKLVIGIDLGTTYSLVAIVRNGKPEVISKDGNKNLIPSIIYFDKEGRPQVGEEARNQLATEPERTIFSIKRLMGKAYHDVEKFKSFLSYEIIDRDEEDIRLGGRPGSEAERKEQGDGDWLEDVHGLFVMYRDG